MVKLNNLRRFHLVMDVIDDVPDLAQRAVTLRQRMSNERLHRRAYTRQVGSHRRTCATGCRRGHLHHARPRPMPSAGNLPSSTFSLSF
jgi:hypothetical protein